MTNYREILRLSCLGLNKTQIAQSVGCSRTTVIQVLNIAEEKGIPYSFCDREIATTLKRAWAKSNLWNKAKLIATLLSSAFDKEEFRSFRKLAAE